MSIDTQRLQQIKGNLSRKPTSELRQILSERNAEVWSEEAFAAATQIIEERQEGTAIEPQDSEKSGPAQPAAELFRRKSVRLGRGMLLLLGALLLVVAMLLGVSYFQLMYNAKMGELQRERTDRRLNEMLERQGMKPDKR